MLVDQTLFMGADPLGYECSNLAEWELEGKLLCSECREMFANEPNRLCMAVFDSPESREIVRNAFKERANKAKPLDQGQDGL